MKRSAIALLCLGAMVTAPVYAQAPHKNVIQKHPTATGVVAGIATHSALKRSAAWKKKHHQKLTWAERHPTLSGIGAGAATRAIVKKTTSHAASLAHPHK